MGIEINTLDGNCQARIDGELTIYTAAQYRESLLEHFQDQRGFELELDLEEVTEIDTAGIQLLIALRKHLDQCVSGLHLKKSSEPVKKALQLTQLGGAFDRQTEKGGQQQ